MKKKSPSEFPPDLEKFIAQAPMPMVLVDGKDDFRFVLTNKEFKKSFSSRLPELKLQKTFQKVMKSGKPSATHGEIHKNQYFDTYTYAVTGPKKKTRYLMTILIDVTSTFEDAQQLKLERDLRDTFLTHMGHDLTQPLANAKFSAQKLQELLPPESDLKRISKITLKGLERIESIFKNLLDAYYLNATQSTWIRPSEFRPVDVTKALLEVFAFTSGERFRFVAKSNLKVRWDREAYLRILENLLSNAVKYSLKDSLITVSIADKKSSVRLSVHNSGPAIPAHEQRMLFRMFQKVSTGKGLKGWGLGLAIVKGIAESHSGSVGVKSSRGKGTTFFVDLPRIVKSA